MERFAFKIDKSLKANLYKICRLCGIDNPSKVKVLDDEATVNLEDGEPELWKKVLDCVGLWITKDDKMPQFMCTLCVEKINDFFEFREMCYTTDGQTRKLLGIKEEPKVKLPPTPSTPECKTEDEDIKLPAPVVSSSRPGRKRRNADLDVSHSSVDIKPDDIKQTPATTGVSAAKKKRLKLDATESDTKPDVKPGPAPKPGPASKQGHASKLPLSKKRLKAEPVAKEKKDLKQAKMTKLMQKKLKLESVPKKETTETLPLQVQKKKKVLEILKQQKLSKKDAVVKSERVKRGASEPKIKEEIPVRTPVPAATQPKVKLKDTCMICNEGFLNKNLLDKHVKATHIPIVARYHCVQCNETLKKNMEIKNHNLWHKLSKTPFQCGRCVESSCSIYTYTKHIRDCGQVAYLDVHIPDWHCPECSEFFQTTYLFNVHSCVAKKLICPGCDRSLKWKEDFLKHIPSCAEAYQRIPPYMSTNIQVKNEAEHPCTSPLPHSALPPATSLAPQATPTSRRTPPLMDSNQCVVIPAQIDLHEGAASPSSKSGKKSKRITKKDLKRFDKLLKTTMTTLVSIKQEPAQGEAVGDEHESMSSDVRVGSESPPRSPSLPGDDDFHGNNDEDDSADEQLAQQPVGTIKQEIIDEGYRDLYNDIEVNIKREVVLTEPRGTELTSPKKTAGVAETESTTPKPVLKLKITKEHGTLNSVLLDSPKSERKKKKKKRKEEKLKAAEREEMCAKQGEALSEADVPALLDTPLDGPIEEEPAMPLPGVIHIKQEITEPEEAEKEEQGSEDQASSPIRGGTFSIVAASSGSMQISCVAEGVQFNGTEETETEDHNQTSEEFAEQSVADAAQTDEEIDIKPRLEDLIPMLKIASVSSCRETEEQQTRPTMKRKRRQTKTSAKSSTFALKIASVSSGTEMMTYPPLNTPEEPKSPLQEPRNAPPDTEESREKVDDNENVFDYTQIRIKEEVVDPTYEAQELEMQEEEQEQEDKQQEAEEKSDDELTASISAKQAEEDAYIASIDFNNITIKEEKECIVDNNADRLESDDESSESETESSSDDNESDNDNSESEREYRELPSEEDESEPTVPDFAPIGLQISAVRSELTNYKTESELDSEDKIKPNSATNEVASNKGRKSNEDGSNSPMDVNDSNQPAAEAVNVTVEQDPSFMDGKDETSLTDGSRPVEGNQASISMALDEPEGMEAEAKPAVNCDVGEKQSNTSFEVQEATSRAVDEPPVFVCNSALEKNQTPAHMTVDIEARSPLSSAVEEDFEVHNASEVNDGNTEPAVTLLPSISLAGDEINNYPDSQTARKSAEEDEEMKSPNVCHLLVEPKQISNTAENTDTLRPIQSNTAMEVGTETKPANFDLATDIETHPANANINVSSILMEHHEPVALDDVCSGTLTNIAIVGDISECADDLMSVDDDHFEGNETVVAQAPAATASILFSFPTRVAGIRDIANDCDDLELTNSEESLEHPSDDSLTSETGKLNFLQSSIGNDISNLKSTMLVSSPRKTSAYQSDNLQERQELECLPVELPVQQSCELTVSTPLPNVQGDNTAYPNDTVAERQELVTRLPIQQSCALTVSAEPSNLTEAPAEEPNKSTVHADFSNVPKPASRDTEGAFSTTNVMTEMILNSNISEQTATISTKARLSLEDESFDITECCGSSSSPTANLTSISAEPNAENYSIFSEPALVIPTDSQSNVDKLCASTSLTATSVQMDDNTKTAGQLPALIISTGETLPQTHEQPAMSSKLLTDTTPPKAPVQNVEIQNLLNEETVAANNFEQNDRIRAMCSTSAPAIPDPNFTDLENVNEIAENNNNANIERELQDELGNVLAAVAVPDRPTNDEDDDNATNENRANFDILP